MTRLSQEALAAITMYVSSPAPLSAVVIPQSAWSLFAAETVSRMRRDERDHAHRWTKPDRNTFPQIGQTQLIICPFFLSRQIFMVTQIMNSNWATMFCFLIKTKYLILIALIKNIVCISYLTFLCVFFFIAFFTSV